MWLYALVQISLTEISVPNISCSLRIIYTARLNSTSNIESANIFPNIVTFIVTVLDLSYSDCLETELLMFKIIWPKSWSNQYSLTKKIFRRWYRPILIIFWLLTGGQLPQKDTNYALTSRPRRRVVSSHEVRYYNWHSNWVCSWQNKLFGYLVNE